jgi:hypothetical protein
MIIRSRDSQQNTANFAEVWFSCNCMDNNYWTSDAVYAIHCSSDINYPYFRSLVEYNTFEPGSIDTNKSYTEPVDRYIGESTKVQQVTLSKIIFPAFLRQQGYRYAYVYDTVQSGNPNWYSQIHNGTTACIHNWTYELFDDAIDGEDDSGAPYFNCDYDIVVQFTSSIDPDVTPSQIVECIHTSNFSKPHLTQVSRVSTQENYGNVLSTNTFMSLADTMNGFVHGNMLIAEDFSMRYIGDQLLLTKPTSLSVCFSNNDGIITTLVKDRLTSTTIPLPGDLGCYLSEVLPSNASSTSINPYVVSITVKEPTVTGLCYNNVLYMRQAAKEYDYYKWINGSDAIYTENDLLDNPSDSVNIYKYCASTSSMSCVANIPDDSYHKESCNRTYPYESGKYYNCINIGCYCNNTQFIFTVNGAVTPSYIRLGFSAVADPSIFIEGILCYTSQTITGFQWKPSNNVRPISLSPVTTGYTLYYPDLPNNLLSQGTDNTCDIVIEPAYATCKQLSWCFNGSQDICILGGVLENSEGIENCKSAVWVNESGTDYLYTCTESNNDYYIWENTRYSQALPDTIEAYCLYSATNCFCSQVDLYSSSDLSGDPIIGFARNTTFIPVPSDDPAWSQIVCHDIDDSDGYVECYCVKAIPATWGADASCWDQAGYCNLCFTYAPTGVQPIGSTTYYLSEYWPWHCLSENCFLGTCFSFGWLVSPTLCKNNVELSIPYCSVRQVTITEEQHLGATGSITSSVDGFTNQEATYTLTGDVTAGCTSVIENGEWVQFRNCTCWTTMGLSTGCVKIDLDDKYNAESAYVCYTTNANTCFYYASIQIRPPQGETLPNPYLFSRSTLQLNTETAVDGLRIVAQPNPGSDTLDYTTSCDDLIEVCYDVNGPYWHKIESPNFGPSVVDPEDVPIIELGICSCEHPDIYSAPLYVQPVYSVTGLSLTTSVTVQGQVLSLSCGTFDGSDIYPDASGNILYLSIAQPITDPAKTIIDGNEVNGWEIGPFIEYTPTYATVSDQDISFIEDSTHPLTPGLNLVTRSGHGYITVDLKNDDYINADETQRNGASIINVTVGSGSTQLSIPFYINVTENSQP